VCSVVTSTMPIIKPRVTSLGSLIQPDGPITMGDRHPSMLINIRSELDINTGKAKNVKITIAQLDKEIFDPGFILDFSRCGNSDTLNIHVGLRPPDQIPYLGDRSQSFQNVTTDDYSREILKTLKNRPELKHLEIMIELRRDQDFRVFKPCPKGKQLPYNFPLFLQHLQIEVPGLSPSSLPIWKLFLEQQTHLLTLICNFGVILWNFYASTITKNSRTLQKVILRRIRTYDPDHPTQSNSFDWSIFANCDRLKFIKLTCVRDDLSRMLAVNGPYLPIPDRLDDKFLHYNFQALSIQSLEEIHVARVQIDLRNLQWLKANAEKLKVICVDCSDKEFYDADKGDLDTLRDDWGGNNFASFENYHFDVVQVERKMNQGMCCAIIFVVFLLFIALILGVVFIYQQSKYDNAHMRKLPNFNNKTT